MLGYGRMNFSENPLRGGGHYVKKQAKHLLKAFQDIKYFLFSRFIYVTAYGDRIKITWL
jgi:hypothetical protein